MNIFLQTGGIIFKVYAGQKYQNLEKKRKGILLKLDKAQRSKITTSTTYISQSFK